MKQMIKNFFRKKKPEDFKEKIYRMKVNKISRDVFIKKDRIEFYLKSEGEFDFFTKILLQAQAQENDRSISFSIGPQDGIQTVTIFLPKEKLNGIENVQNVREFFTEVRIPVKKFTKETNFE